MLEKLSTKYGIVIQAVGGLCVYDEGDIVSVQYSRDHTSGDLMPEHIKYDPDVNDEYEMGGYK